MAGGLFSEKSQNLFIICEVPCFFLLENGQSGVETRECEKTEI